MGEDRVLADLLYFMSWAVERVLRHRTSLPWALRSHPTACRRMVGRIILPSSPENEMLSVAFCSQKKSFCLSSLPLFSQAESLPTGIALERGGGGGRMLQDVGSQAKMNGQGEMKGLANSGLPVATAAQFCTKQPYDFIELHCKGS